MLTPAGALSLFLCLTPVAARAQGCTAAGFLLVVETPGLSLPDSVYAQSMAHALAYRWPVPSRHRESNSQWRRTRRRTLPPAPRWADDYQPGDSLRATFDIVIPRRGRSRALAPSRVSGDELFDRSLRLMVTEPLPASPELPPFPASVTADSLIVRVHLGAGADSVAGGRIRFASGQRPVVLEPGSLEFNAPRGPTTPPASQRFATVKYDVNEQGRVLPSTIEVLDSSDRELAEAIRAALARARFRAAEQDCRPVTISVVQTFRG
jgi:hypothetical protein